MHTISLSTLSYIAVFRVVSCHGQINLFAQWKSRALVQHEKTRQVCTYHEFNCGPYCGRPCAILILTQSALGRTYP
ncbi:hypothetical protein EDD15DRAFT_2290295 [Pisolithus albus]|nr:hypothetical protein EDD15DRAFT_2290295 [Pisolithus albus]